LTGGGRARLVVAFAKLVGLTLLASSCATASLPPPADVAARARASRSYSAELRVSLKGSSLRGRARVLVAFERPDALRVEVPGPAGARLVAVARGGKLTAVFPAEAAVFRASADAASFDALLGIALAPEEMIDLLLGVPSPRLRSYSARWGREVPREVEATLPDGGRLHARIEAPEIDASLPAAAFEEPAHAGYRAIDADEARRIWGER
jgi:hypothetical protein